MKQTKRVLAALIAISITALFFGCKSVPQTGGNDATRVSLGQTELVHYSKDGAGISLEIPAGWEYEIKDEEGTTDFCIAFWPAGQKEGKIEVWYNTAFGVCGTGLTQQTVTIGKYAAHQGTYAGQRMFDFISFDESYRDYVIINEGAEAWWDTQGSTAMQILRTLKLGNNAS